MRNQRIQMQREARKSKKHQLPSLQYLKISKNTILSKQSIH